jgi:hypothetical protein
VALVVAASLAACGGGSPPYEPGRQAVAHVEVGDWNPGETVAPSQGWPWPTMSDVPPFPGTLDPASYRTGQLDVGDGGLGSYTLDFIGVSYKQFQAYAMLLRSRGFTLEGLVYYNSDEAGARAKGAAGIVDQLVAVKDTRTLMIWAPSQDPGSVRFDISGLTQAELDAIPLRTQGPMVGVGANGETYLISGQPIPSRSVPPMPTMPGVGGSVAPGEWPSGWADVVPEPTGCVIDPDGTVIAEADHLYVVCLFPDADVNNHQAMIRAYVAQLTAAGFTLVSQVESKTVPDGVALVNLSKGSVAVTLSDTEPTGMTVVGTRS